MKASLMCSIAQYPALYELWFCSSPELNRGGWQSNTDISFEYHGSAHIAEKQAYILTMGVRDTSTHEARRVV